MEISLVINDQRVKSVKSVFICSSVMLDQLSLAYDVASVSVEIVTVPVSVDREDRVHMGEPPLIALTCPVNTGTKLGRISDLNSDDPVIGRDSFSLVMVTVIVLFRTERRGPCAPFHGNMQGRILILGFR